MDRIASGEIYVSLEDREAIAGLRRLDAEFDRTMGRIEHAHAVATVDADLAPFDDKVANAKRKLRALEGQRATATLDAHKETLDTKIREARAELKKFDGERATAELKVKGEEKVLAAQERIRATQAKADAERERALAKLQKQQEAASAANWKKVQQEAAFRQRMDRQRAAEEAAEARAAEKASNENWQKVQREATFRQRMDRQRAAEEAQTQRERERAANENWKNVQREAAFSSRMEAQRVRELASDERAAHAMHNERMLGSAQEAAEINRLQKQYANLTDRLEAIKRKTPIGREARAKVDLDEAGVLAQMELLKAKLNLLGSHPPVDIKANVDRRGLDRIKGAFTDLFAKIANKAAGLQDVTMRLGPFTGSVRQFAVALSFLGPTITDLLGSASALVGVVGAGIAGAATLASGALVGLVGGVIGLGMAIRPIKADFKIAQQATLAYTKAVDKYGASSKQAKDAQAQMNSVLKTVDPVAAQAARGLAKFQTHYDSLTKPTRANFGQIIKEGFQTLDSLSPMFAQRTNQLSGMLAQGLSGAFKFLRGPEGKGLLDGILGDFNAQIPTVLHGLGNFGHAFLNIAREGAANLGVLTHGFDSLGQKLLSWTQSDTFTATIKRWVSEAQDLMRFFGAAGRVVMHFFGAGQQAGDRFVNSMTNALNRWDKFLTSDRGRNQVADEMDRAVTGTEKLWRAIAPLAGAFVQWSNTLSPIVTGFLQAVGYVSQFVGKMTQLVGLTGPLGALGATLGTLWAVGKIGAFISAIARAVGVLRDLIATEGALSALKFVATGGLFARGAAGAATTVAEGAAAGEVAGFTASAARTAAAAGAVEEAVAGAGAAAIGTEAAFGGLTLATGAATAGIGLLAAGAAYGIYKLVTMKSESDKLHDSFKLTRAVTDDLRNTTGALSAVTVQAGAATATYRQELGQVSTLKARLSKLEQQGKKDTLEYSNTLAELNQHLAQRQTAEQNAQRYRGQQQQLMGRQIDDTLHLQKAQADLNKALNERNKQQSYLKDYVKGSLEYKQALDRVKDAQKDVDQAQQAYDDQLAAVRESEKQATINSLNYSRALRGFVPLVGAAAQAVANLARKSPSLAKSLSIKYPDPKDAAKVAGAAGAALKSGSSVQITARIIADSKDAEDAVKRLEAARITPKKLSIVQEGGEKAIKVLSDIAGRKLTRKEQRIAQTGGPGVIALLAKIVARKLPPKTQHTNEVGSERVLGAMDRISAYKLPDKKFRVWLQDQASARLGSIISSLAQIHDKSVTVSIKESVARLANVPHAAGLPKGKMPKHNALVGEGGAPEYRVNAKKGIVQKVMGPTFMKLGRDDAIIPTEQRYRNRGRDIFKDIAKDLGLSMFAAGKKAKKPKPTEVNRPTHKSKLPLSQHGKSQQHKRAHNWVTQNHTKNYGDLAEINQVAALKVDEQNQRDAISLADRQWERQAPDTYIMLDPQQPYDVLGNPRYVVDAAAVQQTVDHFNEMASMVDKLIAIIIQIQHAIAQAQQAISNAIWTSQQNIAGLQSQIAGDTAWMNRKGASNSEKAAARERVSVYKAALTDEQTKLKGYKDDRASLRTDYNDYTSPGIILANAQEDRAEYLADASGAQGDAGKEVASSNTALPDLPTPSSLAIAKAESEGDVPGQIAGYNMQISEAQAQLSDQNPYNDVDAYNAITSAKAAIQNLQDSGDSGAGGGTSGGGTATTSFAQQLMNLSGARSDLYKSFGSNFALASNIGLTSTPFGTVGAYGPNPAAVAPAGGSTVNVVNNYLTQPADPHTWSQGLAWELQAAV